MGIFTRTRSKYWSKPNDNQNNILNRRITTNGSESGKWIFLLLSILVTGVICQENVSSGEGATSTTPEQNTLSIVPSSKNRVYQRALGKSSIFTCTANVEFPDKLTDFRWYWPDGKMIEQTGNSKGYYDEMRVEIMRDHAGTSLTLLFTSIQEKDLGTYKCAGVYDQSQQLSTDFSLRAFVPITFEDAPTNQYAVKGQDYKVKCQVKADPEPQVDWKKDHRVINNSAMISTHSQLIPISDGADGDDHFEMDKDGVLIRGVTEADEGVYTCRVRVTSMGTVEERHIQVEVHEHPKLTSQPEEVEAIEEESVTLQCSAVGKPEPEYDWVNHGHQDLRHLERHTVDKYKGTLTIENITGEDAGEYICSARNAAGSVTMKSTLNVVTKPVIEELKNITTQVNGVSILTCRASGDPAPDIKFHKDGIREPYSMGPQTDTRIVSEQKKEGRNTVATLKISDVLRTDDGLYNCIAYNKRTKTELLGHVTVEFPPTFVNSPMRETWSWDGRAVNVTCLAEAIPNATISWFIEGSPERSVGDSTPGIKQIGSQSQSSLEIKPEDRSLFGTYKCVAINKLGTAEHRIQLREARKPGPILEAIVHEKTATSITYKIVGPRDDGGLPVINFVAQYKENRESWEVNRLKSWPIDQEFFTIDGLEPLKKYVIRFAAENEVGLGNWALEKQETTPRRSAPEVPLISNEVNGDTAITAYPDRFELIWKVPQDNGESIERFEITYQPVRNVTLAKGPQVEYLWDPIGPKMEEMKAVGEPRLVLRNLAPGTYYKVELRARNKIGASGPAEIIIKTAAVPGGSYELMKGETSTTATSTADTLPMMIILLAVLVAVVILFLVDISCCRINQTGLIWMISSKMCSKRKSSLSLVKDANIHEKSPLNPDDTCVTVEDAITTDQQQSNGHTMSGAKPNGNGSTSTTNGNHSSIAHTHPTDHQHPQNSQV